MLWGPSLTHRLRASHQEPWQQQCPSRPPPKQSRATAWFWLQQTSPNRPSNAQQLVVISI